MSYFFRGSCLIRVKSVLYRVRIEQIKSATSQIVLKGIYNYNLVKTQMMDTDTIFREALKKCKIFHTFYERSNKFLY